jgi:hypothetical protein
LVEINQDNLAMLAEKGQQAIDRFAHSRSIGVAEDKDAHSKVS